jgi:hypothetical protein
MVAITYAMFRKVYPGLNGHFSQKFNYANNKL